MRHSPSLLFRPAVRPLVLALILLVPGGCDDRAPPTLSLARAVQIGDLDQLQRHLHARTDLNQPDANGDRPLHLAARAGQVVVARALAEHGADLNARDGAGRTPLDLALLHGRTGVAAMLIAAGAPLDPQAALVAQVRAGAADRDTLDFLLRRGADLNRPDAEGRPPLHLAVLLGHLETIKRLIARGADVNRPDAAGHRPLALAGGRGAPMTDKIPNAADIRAVLQQAGARP